MDVPDQRKRMDAVFSAALELSFEDRERYLEEACGGDAELRVAVEELLRASDTEDSLLLPGGPLAGALGEGLEETLSRSEAIEPGERIGPFRVLRELGRGGMAVVYEAERADGQFEQQVALKLLKLGADSEELLRRFGQERQILASFQDHHIARLLDGGLAPDGRPYFAMELVDGLPIDRYCDEQKLSVRERLRLFMDVGRAVETAHRSLVVHRDLKPSNILVTHEGEVKLLDFGIAKLVDPGLLEGTRTEVRAMTPEYASPEQFRGELVTTASDVYQLGVLLYLLLTGQRPFAVDESTPVTLQKAVCEREPRRPSWTVRKATTLTGTSSVQVPLSPESVSQARKTRPERLHRLLAGDLDNIVLKALRKEPERRYHSVERLVDDIERYLDGRPVLARQAGFVYRASKFLRRHALAASLVAGALVLLAVVVGFYTVRLAEERDRARQEAAKATEVADFLASFFEVLDPFRSGDDVDVRRLLDRGADRLTEELAGQPEVRARLSLIVGDVYRNLGDFQRAREITEEAHRLNLQIYGPEHLEVSRSLFLLGMIQRRQGFIGQARRLFEETLEMQRRTLSPDHPEIGDTLIQLAIVVRGYGEHEAALEMKREAVRIFAAALGEEDPRTLEARIALGNTLIATGRPEEGVRLLEPEIRKIEAREGTEAVALGAALRYLGRGRHEMGDFEGARDALVRSRDILEVHLGEHHQDVATTLVALGHAHWKLGELPVARSNFDRALKGFEATVGPDATGPISTAHTLADLLVEMEQPKEARRYLRHGLAGLERLFGENSLHFIPTLEQLVTLELASGDPEAAYQTLRRVVDLRGASLREPEKLVQALRQLADFEQQRGAPSVARELLEEAEALEVSLAKGEAVTSEPSESSSPKSAAQ